VVVDVMFEQGQANPAIQPVLAPLRHSDLQAIGYRPPPTSCPTTRTTATASTRRARRRSAKIEWRRRPGTSRRRTTKWMRCPGVIRTTNARSTPCTRPPIQHADGRPCIGGSGGHRGTYPPCPRRPGSEPDRETRRPVPQWAVDAGPLVEAEAPAEFRPPSASRLTPNTPPEPPAALSGKAAQASAPV
jgi:hypothetical protein